MSKDIEKLIEQENQHILEMLHAEQALYVHVYYSIDKDGKQVYDRQTMREEFEENMETLISLNQQRECETKSLMTKKEIDSLNEELNQEAQKSAILQDALECIVQTTDDDPRTIAEETLEAIAEYRNWKDKN